MISIIKEYKIYILFFIVFFLVNNGVELQLSSDDGVYLQQVNEKGILKFTLDMSLNWQPRFYSFFYQAVMYKSLLLWKILNSIIMTLILFVIEKITTFNKKSINITYLRIFLVCSIFFMHTYVYEAIFWYTGSFFYLWPFIFFIIAMMLPVYTLYGKEITNKYLKILIIISTILTSYTEQYISTLVVFSLFVLLYLLISKSKINKFFIIQFIVAIINMAIFVFLMFKTIITKDLTLYFPNYDMLSVVEKIYNGVNYVNGFYINQSNTLFIILLLLMFIVYITQIRKKENKHIILDIIFSFPLVYMIIRLIHFNSIIPSNWKIQEKSIQELVNIYLFETLSAAPNHMITSISPFIPSFISFAVIMFVGLSMLIIFTNIKDKIFYFCLYGAAMVSGYIVSFSATVFASGGRVFFIGHMLLITIIGKLWFTLLEQRSIKYRKIVIVLSIVMVIVAIKYFLQLYSKYN